MIFHRKRLTIDFKIYNYTNLRTYNLHVLYYYIVETIRSIQHYYYVALLK